MTKSVKAIVIIVAFVFSVICIAPFFEAGVKEANAGKNNRFCVVIDAGHGGIDGGVTGRNSKVAESEINLAIALKLQKLFENAAIKTVLTRKNSGGLYGLATKGYKRRDMQKRAEIIKNSGADLFISIHQNFYSDSSRRGAQVFFYSEKDKNFASAVQNKLNSMKEASRECEILYGDYFVLKQADFPACIVECGFLSNAEDERLLIEESYREKLASAIFCGTLEYLTGAGEKTRSF